MERAIYRGKLNKNDIHPPKLMAEYSKKVEEDLNKMEKKYFQTFNGLENSNVQFKKLGMNYVYSKNIDGIFLSPRPNKKMIYKYYQESGSRKFWLKEILEVTAEARVKDIILPQLNWTNEILMQHLKIDRKKKKIFESHPVHWLYLENCNIFDNSEYYIHDPFFPTDSIPVDLSKYNIIDTIEKDYYDVSFLFESLDRAINPFELIRNVYDSLKVGGLCFITCLLSSGFEAKMLGEHSNIFFPPEKMNLFSYEGMMKMIEKIEGFNVIEFSTPSLLDIENVSLNLPSSSGQNFLNYILNERNDEELRNALQDFLQRFRLGSFARIALIKNK